LTSDVRAMQREPLFESSTLPVLEDVIATFTQRGTEYSDTRANGKWSAVRQRHEFIGAKKVWTDEERQTILAASMVDVKIARLPDFPNKTQALF